MQNDASVNWTGNDEDYTSKNTKQLNTNELIDLFSRNEEISRLIFRG